MRTHYVPLQIALHWLVVILVVGAYCAMLFRDDVAVAYQPLMEAVHFSCGIGVFILMLGRVVARIMFRTPAITPKLHPMMTGLSHLLHLVIYVMFIALPMLGFLSMYFKGSEWVAWGVSMPFAAEADEDREFALQSWHQLIANTGYFIIGIHALAALFHHYIRKDNTLLRMLPGKRS